MGVRNRHETPCSQVRGVKPKTHNLHGLFLSDFSSKLQAVTLIVVSDVRVSLRLKKHFRCSIRRLKLGQLSAVLLG